MHKRAVLALVAALVGLALVGAALAGPPFRAKPFEFDPDGTGIVDAAWLAHEGLPDAGNSNHALFLAKDGLTATNASSGAIIQGVAGIMLTELGFDVRTDGHCGAGAPRFNVRLASDPPMSPPHFLGCAAGPVSGPPLIDPQGNTWIRKRWDMLALLALGTIPPGSTVVSISIVFDEGTDAGPGFTHLDNIDINGVLIGKPGNAF